MPSNRFRIICLALAACASLPAQTVSPDLYRELRWRCIGPFRGGRTRAAAGGPGRPNLFYMGQVNGGVWKSDDYGRTWIPIFDDQPTQSIGAIAVAPSDPNLIYVASGEGLQRPDLSTGDGIYKSTDAGKTWIHLGLRDGQQIPALAVDPRDKNRLFAAVLGHPYGPNSERGIFRSTDGAQTWQRVLYIDENTGASDVQMDPSNSDVLYASLWEARQGPWEFGNEYSGTHGGLFKSTDGGSTWRKLAGGLPAGLTQIYVAIAPSDPRRLYAAVATSQEVGIYRSDDAGENWVQATTDRRPATRIGGGDLPVPKVDPKNPDIVYSASIVMWRSADGGRTWTGIKGAPGGDDYQNIWINPDNPDVILLVGDQGAVVSVNRGRTWSSWYNQPTAQVYHAIATNTFPYQVCGGQQESGSVCTSSRGNDGAITFREWHPVGVIEYGYVAPDPADPDIIYGAGRGQVSKFHRSTGQVEMVTPNPLREEKYRADRTQPILFSPLDPHVLFYAANVLFKTTDGARSWQVVSPDLTRPHPGIPSNLGTMAAGDPAADRHRGVIYALAPSFQNIATIWAGTDEGLIWLTRNGGKNWADITPPALTPWSKVTQLEASHFDDQSAYAAVSRFRVDDRRPYIYRTHDGGKTWKLITTGLDDAPIDTVREDPVRKGLLFAGSETSVWVSFDDGDRWQSLQLNLPHTSMRDLWIHDNDLIVGTHGRSFWILDDITPLRQISRETAPSGAVLFQPAPAYLVRRDTNTDTPLPPDEPAGENPPDGAILDYVLPPTASGDVTLEISDAKGGLVRRYSSADRPELSPSDLQALPIPPYWVRAPRILAASPGMHRCIWDLRASPPDALRREFPISAVPHNTPRLPLGPRVPPGVYTAKLTAGSISRSVSLTVKMDPRVKASPADLERQFAAESELAAKLTRSTEAIRQARSVREQIEKLSRRQKPGAPLPVAYEALDKKTSDALGRTRVGEQESNEAALIPVNSRISMLYRDIDSADAALNAAQQAALEEIRGAWSRAMERWKSVVETDIPALNLALNRAGLAEIRLNAKPAGEGNENEDDEE